MLNYTPALLKETLIQDLQIKEISPIMKLIVRGKKREFLSAVGKSLNLLLPTGANTSSASEKIIALWLSPDEWMIYSNQISKSDNNDYETENLLNNNISKLYMGAAGFLVAASARFEHLHFFRGSAVRRWVYGTSYQFLTRLD